MADHSAGLSERDLADLRALGALARAGVEDKRDDVWVAQTDLAAASGARGARRLALATVFTMIGVLGASVGIALVMTPKARDARTQVRASVAPAVPLAYTVERLARGATSAEVPSPDAAESRYLFADGTTVSTAAAAAISIDAAAAARPLVRLVHGRVRVHVVHHDGRQWTFHAGPFDVRVTGTAFDLTWDVGPGQLALHMREGAVEVRGPGLAGPARVSAGQDLAATVNGDAPAITSTTPAIATGPDPDGRPPVNAHASRAHEAAPGRGESWRTLVGRGAFAAVLAQARQRPLAACLSRCSSDELRALGDAARYSRHPALATRALASLRRRFPATPDGAAATFLLGRTAEAQGQWKDAADWYARYLQEAPTGEFSVEAAAGRARASAQAAEGAGPRPRAGRDRSMN